ncbi:23S rRNA (guanosine(2251)-2'-O)-methyltransferase RlmB [Robiginitalea sp. M366]|uniref:23S rRNA (guanosine(2251)-2'-O)-methyltransferase RlmB n=1 Tax=Robiginitalea aestuariiviva TaxID=3036903 RepID=UPI00240D9F04|nr:23S rRNA (guanosine(2251)-2'-O)-methyltransferase RlmB [Robiginitalea aestuariiviva]MDG1572089.1 23S rRNA (guanosine(2251)-2'-O)-methyltransferase RlmB [Robiginitalea aestuariiviva]
MQDTEYIYGIRAVLEALRAGKGLERIYMQHGLKGTLFRELEHEARTHKLKIQYVPKERLNRFPTENHQGVVAAVAPIRYEDYQALIDRVTESKKDAVFLLLDGVSDVRNLGAIIRTAACTGVDALILPASGSAPVNADTVKTSAGAVFHLPIARVPHLKDAVYYLQALGIPLWAASEKAEHSVYDANFTSGFALIMGSEGKGVSPALLKLTDGQLRLPMRGDIASLNVSVACGVILYEMVRQRGY